MLLDGTARPYITVIAILVSALCLPRYQSWRDDRAFVSPEWQQAGDDSSWCTGTLEVTHSSATLDRLQATTPNQLRPLGTVSLFYATTQCKNRNKRKINQDEDVNVNQQENHRPHILLLHGTGMSCQAYYDTGLFGKLIHMGYHVTTVDLRGHGRSEITEGPYSVELLGADVAALLRHKTSLDKTTGNNNNNKTHQGKVHCYGISAGFGACMSLATYDSDLVQSLSGSGFLMDRAQHDWLAYIFSREPVVRFLGMNWLASIAQLVMKISKPGLMHRWMSHCHMNGYVHLSSSWLLFNITQHVVEMAGGDDPTNRWDIPTLYMLPEYDEDLGHTLELTTQEIARLPTGLGSILEFPGHSHVMLGEEGGVDKIALALDRFVQTAIQRGRGE